MPATGEQNVQEDFVDEAIASDVATSEDDEGYPQDLKKPYKPIASIESHPNRNQHESFIRESVEILLKDAVFNGLSRDSKVLEWRNPEELLKLLDFEIRASGSSHDELLQLIRETIQYSVKTGHPYFVNQLFSSVDPYGLVGQWLTDALNPSVYTYEVSPVFTLMEEVVLKEMRTIVGFPNGDGDGIFCPGGSMSNAYAISCARHSLMPDIKRTGLHGLQRLVLFTSEDAHYSIKKMASFLGLGSDNVYLIKSDGRGKMDVEHLTSEIERSLRENAIPFMVSATAGTTVFGAFDPIEEIADVCERHKLWLHVDAAWGGGALMSKKYKHLLKGIHRADSVTWNPHKLLTAPQQCSAYLLRHKGVLSSAHSTNAAYLFQKDKFYDTSFDTGDKHVQCGRRADVLKFWFMWKAKGTSGFEQHIDKVFDNAEFFTNTIQKTEGFSIVLDNPECTNICFWYIPPSLRGHETDADYHEKLHSVAPKIKEKMMKEGSMMVTYQAQKSLPNFFRIVFQNSGLNHDDMIHLIQEFERLGYDL
ncbi:PREDICTED: cysteine sulfinic acid decarboxylase [Nicrophorus vespilloides]|uniref:Cysteine sulfinic acid decarboxylase n=1 Tax=Nicrophorus vespilloides TaxID=110193 RepID=A0ABM1M874_NICVS|nr:PREDICTED: cysteine sulfinic acid decarboxylase [Nicrophorus vespilloides]